LWRPKQNFHDEISGFREKFRTPFVLARMIGPREVDPFGKKGTVRCGIVKEMGDL
jgi:hypothetical protein